MILWYKFFTSCLLANSVIMPFSNNTHIHQQEVRMNTNIQDDYLKSTHVATMVTQRLMVDKKYGDKKEHDKTIRFDNAFKKVYLSPDNLETNVKTLLSNCHQLTTPMNKQNDYGYFQYNDSDGETKKDLNNRIEDWSDVYLNNLSCDLHSITNFGISSVGLNLVNSNIWPSNKKISELDTACGFRDDQHRSCIYDKCTDATFGKDNLKNCKDAITGVPFLKIKEEKITNKHHKSKDHLIAYWISGMGMVGNGFYQLPCDNDARPLIGSYDLSKLITINGCSFNEKTIHLELNNDFIKAAQQLDEYHQNVRNQLEGYWNEIHKSHPDFNRTIFDNLIDMNLLTTGTTQYLKLFFVWPFRSAMNIYDYMKLAQSKSIKNYAESLGFNKYDNPWGIINDLKSKMKLDLNYAITNAQQLGCWTKQSKTFDFADLEKGVDVLMGQRGDSDCKFRLDSLVSIEKDTDDTYIGSQTINKFNIATNLIQNDTNNVYKFIKPTISSVEFKNNDLIFNRNYRVDEITNNQLFNQYLMLKTNFGEAADWKLLSQDQFEITRNPLTGIIKITITINDQTYEHQYDGFKINIPALKDIDCANNSNNLIADDLDENEIKQLLLQNNFNSSILDNMHFNVESIDDHKGVATVKVTESQEEKYLNKIFQFFNLRPYFIEQNKKIGSSFKQKKTSEITENDFKNNFITMSDAFVNRHANDLSISLVPNDHKQILTANLTFVDIKTKEPITLTYKYDFNQKSINWSLMITIGGIASIGILVAGLLIYKKIRKPKLQ